jgi:hypothetical protein
MPSITHPADSFCQNTILDGFSPITKVSPLWLFEVVFVVADVLDGVYSTQIGVKTNIIGT